MWLDNLAEALVTWSGNGFDPKGCTLPAFKTKQENRAKLPEKEAKIADVVSEDLLTDDELLSYNWRYHGPKQFTELDLAEMKAYSSRKKPVLVDFDELPAEMHGITEREYGEMLGYTPQLRNLRIASIVKAEKAKGAAKKTWAQVAKETKQTEQTIKHYSSALEKASPSPASK